MPTVTVNREADEVLRELLGGPEGRRNPYPLYTACGRWLPSTAASSTGCGT